MKVLVVEPMKPCYVQEIEGLKAMQEIVGGHIEAIYPFEEQVAIIANEEGKILGLPFNRPLSDEHGVPYDIVCGTFFVVGLGSEDFISLTDDQIQRYKELFDNRMVLTVPEKAQKEKLYFAYGMNVNPKKMAGLCPDAHVVGPAVLEDYELLFRGNIHCLPWAEMRYIPQSNSRIHLGVFCWRPELPGRASTSREIVYPCW